MRLRFWNATALAAGFVTASALAPSLFGQDAAPATDRAPAAEKTAAAPAASGKGRLIELRLAIAGLGPKGCDVDVKPGNPTCVFKPQSLHVKSDGKLLVAIKDVELRGADRNCAVALTIREEGQPAKTIYRGYRVAADPKPGSAESFLCCLSSPSKVAAVAETTPPATRR